jgi:hypothetical protein
MAGDRIQASLAAAFEKVRMDRREIVPMFASLGLRMAGLLCTFGLGVKLESRAVRDLWFGNFGGGFGDDGLSAWHSAIGRA